eukprot:6106187-Amphidinium_carterae.2
MEATKRQRFPLNMLATPTMGKDEVINVWFTNVVSTPESGSRLLVRVHWHCDIDTNAVGMWGLLSSKTKRNVILEDLQRKTSDAKDSTKQLPVTRHRTTTTYIRNNAKCNCNNNTITFHKRRTCNWFIQGYPYVGCFIGC